MLMIIKSAALVLFYFLWSFPVATFSQSSNVSESNIRCLKSIKDSIDPYDYLSWNFSQNTSGFFCSFTGVWCSHSDGNEVLNIQLSNMKLKGNFPQGIEYCTSIGRLDLSNNELTGTIPSDIGMLMPSLTSLRLSSNKISGEIPKSLAKIPRLNVLELDKNQLTGHLPEELGLLLDLTTFSVADNLLSGPIPKFRLASFPQESYENNSQLCGRPLRSCNKHTSEVNYPFKISFTIAYLLSTIVVFVFSSSSYLPWPKRVWKTTKNEAYQLNDSPTSKHIIQIIPGFERLVTKISFAQLRRATNNFSDDNVIGVGKTGTVYKATLPNGSFLAVRRLHDSQEDQSQLVSELLTLARLKHDNLIPLLGFCQQNNERLLVYKYMSNGNLRDWLNTFQGEAKILAWPLRVKIAIGIARGLAWIHHECDFKVVHRNISSTCILLDQYFEPRISNFHKAIMSNYGGAMFAYLNENDSGFLMNSEMWETVFVKEDVFNFGVVLIDLITGKESSTTSSSSSSLYSTLVEWINDDVIHNVIDKSLIGQGFDDEILQVLRIASECVQSVPCQRPTMLQVYNSIRNLGDRCNISFDSGSASGCEIVEIQ